MKTLFPCACALTFSLTTAALVAMPMEEAPSGPVSEPVQVRKTPPSPGRDAIDLGSLMITCPTASRSSSQDSSQTYTDVSPKPSPIASSQSNASFQTSSTFMNPATSLTDNIYYNPDYITEDGKLDETAPATSSSHVEEVSSSTRDQDLERKLLLKQIERTAAAQAALRQATDAHIKSTKVAIHSVAAKMLPGVVKPPTSKRAEAAMAGLEEATEDLNEVVAQRGSDQVENLFSQIEEDPKRIEIFDFNQGVRESAPIAQSFQFGILLKQELQQLQQKTVVNKLAGVVSDFGKINPLEDMLGDLGRTHENNAVYSLTEGTTTTRLDQERGEDNLEAFKTFVGENESLQIAIASIMHQGGQSDFEKIKFGVPRGAANEALLPFFTEGIGKAMWRPHMEGPMLLKLFAGENRTESQAYNLTKTATESESPIFQLTAFCTQTVANEDFKYDLNRNVTYQFETNHAFNPNHPISEDNAPVIVTCLDGKIVQTFDDQRTPEQFAHQVAQYNLAVYQNQLADLNPDEIQAAYENKVNQLTARAPMRSGSITAQDLKDAKEASVQPLKNAREAVKAAQREVLRTQRHVNGLIGGEYSDTENEWND